MWFLKQRGKPIRHGQKAGRKLALVTLLSESNKCRQNKETEGKMGY